MAKKILLRDKCQNNTWGLGGKTSTLGKAKSRKQGHMEHPRKAEDGSEDQLEGECSGALHVCFYQIPLTSIFFSF